MVGTSTPTPLRGAARFGSFRRVALEGSPPIDRGLRKKKKTRTNGIHDGMGEISCDNMLISRENTLIYVDVMGKQADFKGTQADFAGKQTDFKGKQLDLMGIESEMRTKNNKN